MAKLTVLAIECKVHSTGVDPQINDITHAVQQIADVGAASAAIAGPEGVAVGAALKAAGDLVVAVFNLAAALDRAGDYPDQLYLSLSNDPGVGKVFPVASDYYNIRGGQIVRPNLELIFTDAVDINFWEYDSGSADDFLGKFTVDETHVGGVRFQIVAREQEGAVYVVAYKVERAVQPRHGVLNWYQHLGWSNGARTWSGPVEIGVAWDQFAIVCSGAYGVLYAIEQDGDIQWYRHNNSTQANSNISGPVQVGNVGLFTRAFCPFGTGVILTVDPNGDLIHCQHWDFTVGRAGITPPVRVGSGWGAFKHVFGTEGGVIYGVTQDGKLMWHHLNTSYPNPPSPLQGPKQVGEGWDVFQSIFAGQAGTIYGIRPDGVLVWYHHQGWQDGSVRWAGPVEVGTGWQHYRSVIGSRLGIVYAITQ